MKAAHQPAILVEVPASARFATLALRPGASRKAALAAVRALVPGDDAVVGVGAPLVAARGLHAFPALSGPEVAVPSTQGAVWLAAHGVDPGASLHRLRALLAPLAASFVVTDETSAFRHGGRDLTGYEDGTENPKGRERSVAIRRDGASFVSVQRWVHDLDGFAARSQRARDHVIGRARTTNEELGDAPESAHVKRSAQESFPPKGAFMVRRSMPFGDAREHGLVFVAFGASVEPFERVLRRMVGLDDGVVDALFSFTRPVTGGHYLCPSLGRGGALQL